MMNWVWTSDVIGTVGVVLVLVAYYLLQAKRMESSSIRYLNMNIIGSALILYSLFFNWNTPAVLVEVMWLIISLWGMFKTLYNNGAIATADE